MIRLTPRLRAALLLAPIAALLLVFEPKISAAEPSVAPREGWMVFETAKSYAVLSEDLDAAIKAARMGRVTFASATLGARGAGIDIPGNRIVGVYRNDYARRMLQASVAAGIEAPIRFYVTEDADGGATLSYKTPSHVFAPYMGEGGAPLAELAAELDAVFLAIAEAAAG